MSMNKQNIFLIGFCGIIAVVVVFAFASVISSIATQPLKRYEQQQSQQMGQRLTRMSLSSFDAGLAIQFMDKNGDGMCDVCGMPVEMCIDSGQLQCNMDSKSAIGVLGSQHVHADWKIYLKGKAIDLSDKSHMERMRSGQPVSSFIHVDSGAPVPERTGDVLHMHATGVPLWIFFSSIGLELPDVKVYVNEKEIQNYQNYVFKDLDKILITDGIGNLDEQLASITGFAKNH